jgi:hypothetical protein
MLLKTKLFYQSPDVETELLEAETVLCQSTDSPGQSGGDFWDFIDNERQF